MPNVKIPNLSLVVLIGPSGSGKSTFARQHFLLTEVLSSDYCRGLVSDDENSQAATNDAFDVLHYIAAKRLAAGRLTVVDATNVQREARQPLVKLAREFHTLPVAIVFNLPEDICREQNRDRADRGFGAHVIRQQRSQLRRSLKGLKREGFRHVFVLESPEQVDAVTIEPTPLWNDKRDEHGPFDFIGDVHGCCDELEELLERLGYKRCPPDPASPGWTSLSYTHPDGRKAVFVGDLVDRGPRIVDTLSLVRNMVAAGSALCVPGNHDMKLLKKLRGKNVQITHGLADSLAEIDAVPENEREPFGKELSAFLDGLISHYVLDRGKIVVAHAGMKESMQGRGSGRVREFALYGETTGETDEFGLPVRFPWASEYRGKAMVVYGHTPVPEPDWLNRTVNIDTGCIFGGALTALRYPELEFVSVKAKQTYCEPARPFLDDQQKSPSLSTQHEHDDLLDLADVTGKRIISTRLRHNVTIREENGTAALEVMSRFAANPKWLVYLPPTQELLRSQYAAVGAAANAALPLVLDALGQTAARLGGEESDLVEGLKEDFERRGHSARRFVDAYRNYCWRVESIGDLKIAPFHILATEGRTHVQQNHEWHMQTLASVCAHDSQVLRATPYRRVDVTNLEQVEEATLWWTELTENGGEGMVVKPFDFIAKGKKGLLQPAVKCRGREYLRIIYGPDYTSAANLTRLRSRGLGAKRSLALREFALGIEALERFVRREPLRRVHECVFGVLALESEPVDPRL
jgi:predicted kinase/diadenosine tetraphosphatase ApaH/serine/threonine PP2A family protein phosphatase